MREVRYRRGGSSALPVTTQVSWGATQRSLRGVSNRRQVLAMAAWAGTASFVAACAGRGRSTAGGAVQGAGQAEKPRYGGQFNLRVSVDPIDYDPSYNGKTAPGDLAMAQAHNTLMSFKTGPDIQYGEMILVPKLAERWEASPDGTAFTFHIRKGVRFANLPPVHGRELTAEDIKWTFEYYGRSGGFRDKKLPESAVGFMYEGMLGIETPDRYTVVTRFERPFLPFLSYAASDWNAMVPREIYEQDGHLKDRLAGAGPYQLDLAASQKSSQYTWKKNADYWDAGLPYADGLHWLVLPQDATALAAFQTKRVDLLQSLAFPAYQQVQRNNPDARFFHYLQPQGYHLHFSQARGGPLKDVRVRQAIALAVDRDEINKTVAGGQGEWAVTGAVQGLFTEAEARQLQKQDVQEARRLLAEAGYANGLRLEWPYEDDISQANLTWFQLFQAQVKRSGIDVALLPLSKADQRAKRRKGEFDLDVLQALGLLEADADSMMFGTFHSKGSTNWAQIRDPELDKTLEAQRSEVDPTRRRELQKQAAKRIVSMAWGVELIYPPIWDATQPYVHNYFPHFSVRAPFTRAWLTK